MRRGLSPRFALLAPLALSLLLASCGQSSQMARPKAAPASAPALTSPADLAQTPAPQPTEALAPASITDAADSLPGGRPISAQSIDKSVPIVLVHGFTGFGRDELGGAVKYWGGLYDVQKDLNALGYKVFTVGVGPLSSNWDRVAELFAQVKGGCVDYGAAHSAHYGHTRHDSAKCYPGFYPEWDADHPINLIGHSQGGQTTRMLVKLLEDGSPENAAPGNIFTGGRVGWVNSVMAISAAPMGSQAADNTERVIPFVEQLFFAIAATGGVTGAEPLYDFDLGQFGLRREPGELPSSYMKRVFASKFIRTEDAAFWDISPDGAKKFNEFVDRSPNVKYFSWVTLASTPGLVTGWHYPIPSLEKVMTLASYPYPRPLPPGMGNVYGDSAFGAVHYDKTWWANDGVVPSYYMNAPIGESSEKYVGQATHPGQWYSLGTMNGWDHLDIVGLMTLRDPRPFYRNQAAFLSSQNW